MFTRSDEGTFETTEELLLFTRTAKTPNFVDVDVVLDGRRNVERKRRTGRRHRSVEKKWKENTVFHATTLGRERDIAVVR